MKKFAAVTLFFFCMIGFFATPPVSAHDGVTASQASSGDGEDMKNFLLHLRSHQAALAADDDSQIDFRNAMRTDNGVWRRGDTYVITVNSAGAGVSAGEVISFHAKYPSAVSGSLRGIEIFRNLVDRADAGNGEVACDSDSTGNHICAVEDPQGSFIQIAGFNHERGETDHSAVLAACPEFTAEELSGRGWLSADMVNDRESLKFYLEGVVEHISGELASGQQSGSGAQGGIAPLRMIQLMPCWRMPPWEEGSIYFYIVTDTQKMFGIFNGNTPQLQDTTLRLVDNNGVRIAQRILEEVRREDDTPNRGFLTYLWDDPTVRGDEVVCEEAAPSTDPSAEDEEVFCEAGNPVPGRSTGTSVKVGYFIRTDFGLGGRHYVVGSGIYPKSEQGGSGGGCAIASGSPGGTAGTAAVNLFLLPAVLFLAASRGRLPGAKLPGKNSGRGN